MREGEMAMNNNNIKSEARRRRIQDAGTDRLALITGRIQALPPSPRSPSHTTDNLHVRNESAPATLFSHDHDTPRTPFSDLHNSGLDTTFRVLRRESSLGYLKGNAFEFGNKLETQLHKIITDREVLQAPLATDAGTKPEQFPEKSVVQDTLIDEKDPFLEPSKPIQAKLFSSKRVNYCVLYSEGTRSFCALAIALLVVLSNVDHPLLNIVSAESMVASRPLYMLLLTDVMIVVGQVYMQNRMESEEAEAEKTQQQQQPPSLEEVQHNMGEAIVLMERGLLVYQIFRGIFVDFSIYAVVVICGLSLVY